MSPTQDEHQRFDAAQYIEDERRRITDLLEHDVTESLNLLVAQAHAYEQTAGANTQARLTASVLGSLALQALQHVRDLQANLRSTTLETHGLAAALEILAGQTTRLYGLQVDLALHPMRTRLPFNVELALFRAIQMWLSQARSEAHASFASIDLEYQAREVTVRARHNGSHESPDVLQNPFEWIRVLGGAIETHQRTAQQQDESIIRIEIASDIALTEREIDVLRLLLEGRANKEIASSLGISVRTVKFHLDNLYSKIGVNSRVEAVVFALQRGLHNR